MWDLTVDVMRYMRLRDPMGECGRQPSHDRTQVPQKTSIERCQCASWKGKLAGTVVGKEGISMLEECNQDNPVVYPIDAKICQRPGMESEQGSPKIRGQVNLEYLKESELPNRAVQSGRPKEDPDIRNDDLHPLLG